MSWFFTIAILRRSMQRALLEHLPGSARVACAVSHCAAHLGKSLLPASESFEAYALYFALISPQLIRLQT